MQMLRKMAGKRTTYLPDFFPPDWHMSCVDSQCWRQGAPGLYKEVYEAWAPQSVLGWTGHSFEPGAVNTFEIKCIFCEAVFLTLGTRFGTSGVDETLSGVLLWRFEHVMSMGPQADNGSENIRAPRYIIRNYGWQLRNRILVGGVKLRVFPCIETRI